MDARPFQNVAGFAQQEPLPLAMEGIHFRVAKAQILNGVSLSVRPREVLCLLGPSGCGKTTLLRIAAGIERQSAGRVAVAGETVADDRTFVPAERRRLGYVFQDLALFPHLRVAGNVAYGLRGRGASREAVSAALAQVGLKGRERAYPHELSGGEQQRVALVRALLPAPKVVLFDEPFSGLDRGLRETVREDVLSVLRARSATAILVTHDPEEALAMADTIALMRDGRVVQHATPRDIWRDPVDLAAARVFSRINVFHGPAQNAAVSTPLGAVPVPSYYEGKRLAVAFRPDAIRVLSPAQHPAEPHAEPPAAVAKVEEKRFHGTHVDLAARVGGVRVHVRAAPHAVPDADEVCLGADLHQAIVLPAEGNEPDG